MCMDGFAEFGEAPFGSLAYIGMRMWHVNSDGYLIGKNLKPWQCGVTRAECPEGSTPPCACGCGLWAFWGCPVPDYVAPEVVGVIEGLGKIAAGPVGFRAERARILALSLPSYSGRWPPRERDWLISTQGRPGEARLHTASLGVVAADLGRRYQVRMAESRHELEQDYLYQLRWLRAARDSMVGA